MTGKPAKAGPKKVAPTLRQFPVSLVEAAGVHIGANVALLMRDIGAMIGAARTRVAVAPNTTLTALYPRIGSRVRIEVLAGESATCAAEIVSAVSRRLAA